MSHLEMVYRYLGRCGTQVSLFGLGGWTTFGGSLKDPAIIHEIVKTAFDSGVNFFDIADVYAGGEAERVMGKELKEFPRHQLVISSKVYFPASDDVNDRGLSRKHILESIDRSLKRIGTDYLDIYFCHRYDPNTPVEETARAMDDLIHQGKILYWGTSEWTGAQLREVHLLCESKRLYRPQVEQPQYSLLARAKFEQDVREVVQEAGVGVVVWSPLASGLLTGKYDAGIPPGSRLSKIDWLREEILKEEDLKKIRKFKLLADELDCSRAQLALAWVARQPGISSVITGATRADQLRENLGALKIKIPESTRRAIEELFPSTVGG